MMVLLVGLAAVTLFAGAAAPPSDESELLKLTGDWIRALETRDRRRLDQIVAKEFPFIEPDGSVKTREEYLADRSGDDAEIESLSSSDLGVRVHGASAVVTGVAHITERRNGNRYRFKLRWKELWLKHAGRWQVLAGQATPVSAEWDRPFIIGPEK